MSARAETLLWVAQRASAGVLGFAVVVHLITVIIAVQGGVTANEIIARVGGDGGWLAFYMMFVIAVTVHVPIGLRAIMIEWGRMSPGVVSAICIAFALGLFGLGGRAVLGLYALGLPGGVS